MPCKYRWPQAQDYDHFERADGTRFASPTEHQQAWDSWVQSTGPLVATSEAD